MARFVYTFLLALAQYVIAALVPVLEKKLAEGFDLWWLSIIMLITGTVTFWYLFRKIRRITDGFNWSLNGRTVLYRTVHGDLKIRYQSIHSAHQDLYGWLKKHHLARTNNRGFEVRISDDYIYDKDV